jgi:tetratricopeptide (TPR) repeat protein
MGLRKQRDKKKKKLKPRPGTREVIKRLKMPLAMIAVAFIPRLLALLTSSDSPIFNYPINDSQMYHSLAITIANGDLMGSTTFWQAPLYPYFLGLIYWIFGVKIVVAKFIGLLLGAISCYLIFRLADKIIGRRMAWIAYVISMFYGPFIFFEAQLLAPALLNLLILLALLAIDSYRQSRKIYMLVVIGLILSLVQIGHGLIIVFLPFLIGWLIYLHRHQKSKIRKGLVASGWLIVGFLPFIIITATHNYALDREFVPVSSNFGPNFYLGNHADYDSTTGIRPGLEWDEFISEASIAGYNTPAKVSDFFSRKAFSNISDNMPAFAGLLVKKLYYLSGGEEIKRILDIYYFKQYSIVLDAMIWYRAIAFPSGLIIPLAICGILVFITIFRKSEAADSAWPMILFIISQVLAILLFFVSSRYRLVIMPAAILFAAYAISYGIEWIRQRKWRPFIIFLSLFAILLVFCNLPRVELGAKDLAENQFYEGLAMSEEGDIGAAIEKYKEALRIYPGYTMAAYNLALLYRRSNQDSAMDAVLGQILQDNPNSHVLKMYIGEEYLDQGRLEEAKELFEEALSINPNVANAYVDLGFIYRSQGNMALAMQLFNKAIEHNPRSYKAYNHIGATHLMHNRLPQAEQNFQKALDINWSHASARNNLATVYTRTNRLDEAEDLLEVAVKLSPNNPEVLVNYGVLRLRRGDVETSLGLFERAVELAPAMPMGHYCRGMALMRMGQRHQAIMSFKSALKADSSFTLAREELRKLGL